MSLVHISDQWISRILSLFAIKITLSKTVWINYRNLRSILLTFFFAVILVYIFSIFGYVLFQGKNFLKVVFAFLFFENRPPENLYFILFYFILFILFILFYFILFLFLFYFILFYFIFRWFLDGDNATSVLQKECAILDEMISFFNIFDFVSVNVSPFFQFYLYLRILKDEVGTPKFVFSHTYIPT